jgi:hypothetical protein
MINGTSVCRWLSYLITIVVMSLKMTLFEALYGHQCRTPLNWVESDERIFVPNLVTNTKEIVHRIQSNLKATRAQQESYVNKRR